MPVRIFLIAVFVSFLACKNAVRQQDKFDKIKWAAKKDADYPYREAMLKDLVAGYMVHGVKRDTVLSLLGGADRSDGNYLFYTIEQQRLGVFPLHTKTLVIKFKQDSTLEWAKIHE